MIMIEDVTTSGKSMEETVPKVKGAADVEIVGLMVSLNRMEVGTVSSIDFPDVVTSSIITTRSPSFNLLPRKLPLSAP